tara:strand:+ start:202109 stop:202585 length:477 start_codon:yes stop_codon:yes gene_type:complete
MATQLQLITIQSSKEAYVSEGEQLFVKKINPYYPMTVDKIKSNSDGRGKQSQKVEDEGQKILKKLQPGGVVIVFDERGKNYSSEKFAQVLQSKLEESPKKIQFVIGGAFGLSEEIKSKADFKVSLSSMVMNHHIAELVVLEQIYRACTIIRGIPYHNA